jgi:CheY-like chemotaxis protein
MAPQQPSPCERCPRGTQGFVLVVDDDKDTRLVVDRSLTRTGYRVAVAANAREALDSLQAGRRPCVMLLDLDMPIMDGWAFMMARQRDAALASIPVALMSGSIDRRALALDADGYLEKPFDPSRLLAMVAHCCAAWSSRTVSP